MMKHLIIAKFKPEYSAEDKLNMLPDIEAIFNKALDTAGIHRIEVIPNCVARDNRYDVMIRISMDQDALCAWDSTVSHKEWKANYSDKLEKKCIFDYLED